MCKPVALGRAAANLIGNAMSYGGGTVRLTHSANGLWIAAEDLTIARQSVAEQGGTLTFPTGLTEACWPPSS